MTQPHDDSEATRLANVQPADWRNPDPASLYDLVVLGAGTAGLVSAAGAAGIGARVARPGEGPEEVRIDPGPGVGGRAAPRILLRIDPGRDDQHCACDNGQQNRQASGEGFQHFDQG